MMNWIKLDQPETAEIDPDASEAWGSGFYSLVLADKWRLYYNRDEGRPRFRAPRWRFLASSARA